MLSSVRQYYELTKPGIIYGNVMTTIAGYLFASQGRVAVTTMLYTVLAVALIIASGCVYNNYIDRNIDKHMSRTKNRVLVTGEISSANALIFATLLGIVGFSILATKTNGLTVILGMIAIFSYVVIYGYAKRHSVHGTLVGSIPGSMSILAGYVAVTGKIDEASILLFLILSIWQMPHFYAISIFRKKEYASAGLPVSSVIRGVALTKIHTIVCLVLFTIASMLLSIRGFSGWAYLAVMAGVNLWWLKLALNKPSDGDDSKWARKVFGHSLVVLLVFSFMISIDSWLW